MTQERGKPLGYQFFADQRCAGSDISVAGEGAGRFETCPYHPTTVERGRPLGYQFFAD